MKYLKLFENWYYEQSSPNYKSYFRYRPFEEARKFALTLGLNSEKEWREFAKGPHKPYDIPSRVDLYYSNKGWTNWGDFLGTGNKVTKNFLPFEEAREFAQSLGFNKREEWFDYCLSGDLPYNIPANPVQHYYDKGWTNWGDFLGNGNVANSMKKFRSYEEAKEYAQSLGIKDSKEWRRINTLENRPSDIPYSPDEYYKDKGWISWSEFLGNDNISPSKRNILPFEEAREYVQNLNLKSKSEWEEYVKTGQLPKNIPTNAYQYYLGKGWINWKDFLGTLKS